MGHARQTGVLDRDDKLRDGAHDAPALRRRAGCRVADIPVVDYFLLDGVAWHFHECKRIGECGFEALGKVLDVLGGRHKTHPSPVVHHHDCVLPLIDDVFCVPVSERGCGRDWFLCLYGHRVQLELLQDLLCTAQLDHKTGPLAGIVANIASA